MGVPFFERPLIAVAIDQIAGVLCGHATTDQAEPYGLDQIYGVIFASENPLPDRTDGGFALFLQFRDPDQGQFEGVVSVCEGQFNLAAPVRASH